MKEVAVAYDSMYPSGGDNHGVAGLQLNLEHFVAHIAQP